MESLTTPLILSFISAITFVAYKHPKAYSKIYFVLMAIVSLPYFGITLWNAAINKTHNSIFGFVSKDSIDAASAKVASLYVNIPYITVWFFGAMIYIAILLFLENILKHEAK